MSLISEGAGLGPPAAPAASLRRHEPSIASVGDYVALMKPRVVAPGHLHPVIGFTALLCISVGAGAAGALNMWYDADVDAAMTRTSARPIPQGRIAPGEALGFGLTLAGFATVGLGLLVNWLAAALLAFTIFFYVVVYTIWLKRRTPQNIVIGGGGGCLSADDRMGGGDRQHFRRAMPPLLHRFLLDAAAFLGALAHPREGLCARRTADAAGRRGAGGNQTAGSALLHCSRAHWGIDTAMQSTASPPSCWAP
jgi:hypothetical protein